MGDEGAVRSCHGGAMDDLQEEGHGGGGGGGGGDDGALEPAEAEADAAEAADADAEKVKELRRILEQRNVCTEGNARMMMRNDAYLRRFLRARAMDVACAAKMVAEDMAWRAAVIPLRGHVSEIEVQHELSSRKAHLQGLSLHGNPIILILAHRHVSNRKHPLEFQRFVAYTLEKAIASAPKGVEKCLAIVDIKGVGYKNLDLKGMILGLQLLQNHYPERLAKLYFVNVSTLWIRFWNVASNLVDKVTLEKLQFLPSGNMTPILRDIDEAVLPIAYGGKAEMIPIQDAHVPSWPPISQEKNEMACTS